MTTFLSEACPICKKLMYKYSSTDTIKTVGYYYFCYNCDINHCSVNCIIVCNILYKLNSL